MTRQLNLRVEEEFAERLERLSRKLGRPMAAILEAVGSPALEAAEDDLQFEADALAAWEEYELTGSQVSTEQIETIFEVANSKAQLIAEKLNR